MKRSTLLLSAIPAFCIGIHAQDLTTDLSSQRMESQNILKVPGHRIDHEGPVINPVPHLMDIKGTGELDIRKGFRIRDRKGMFPEDLRFLEENRKGIILDIDFGGKAASKAGVRPTEGAYSLSISEKGVSIAGYDEAGAFYGIQTLRQIIEGGTLPFMTVSDWPDLGYRGVVEGFYGTPWSHETRLSLIGFYGRYKMNTYLYGPKDDPYHSCPNWRLPYPEKEAADIRELVMACRRNRVNFIWAIHPGQDIKWNEEDYGNLISKFDHMYSLGVRSFAVFFDDISGEGTNPAKQAELLNRINREFVKAKGDVKPLIVCPTDYSKLWANPGENGNLSIYGRELDPDIDIFWTGDYVCSDLTPETLDWVNSRIRRPALYWWNFPVTDYVRHIVMQGPSYGLDTSLTGNDLCGMVSNPMEHGEASKIALYGVADYCWNVEGYNALDNWERGIKAIANDAADAYRTFAIHSCDTETGYRRSESWETETFRLDGYSMDKYDALMNEFIRIESIPAEMEEKCSNKALLKELKPWLTEFAKLGTRGRNALSLMKMMKEGSDPARFWELYTRNLMSTEDLEEFNAHKSGTLKLQAFYENAMDDMGNLFYKELSGKSTTFKWGIGSFPNLYTTLSKLMFDSDSTTYYTSGTAQGAGAWIGADLGEVTPVSLVRILQGRNSVDDVDYFDHATLECSADGKDWTTLIEDLDRKYIVEWSGAPIDARYVRLRRLESKKQNWAAVRSFEVNPVTPDNLGFRITSEDPDAAIKAFDRNPQSFYASSRSLSIHIPDGYSTFTLLTGASYGETTVRQMDQDGNECSCSKVSGPLSTIEVSENTACISIEGRADIYEIILK